MSWNFHTCLYRLNSSHQEKLQGNALSNLSNSTRQRKFPLASLRSNPDRQTSVHLGGKILFFLCLAMISAAFSAWSIERANGLVLYGNLYFTCILLVIQSVYNKTYLSTQKKKMIFTAYVGGKMSQNNL